MSLVRRIAFAVLAGAWLQSVPVAAAEIRLFTWADYTAPDLIRRFQAETGHTVKITAFDSFEQMRAALVDNVAGYDLAVPAEYHVGELIQAGLLQRVHAYRLPGFENIEENWRGQYYDPGNDYSIPWHWGTTSFVYDSARSHGSVDSLKALFEPEPGDRVGLIDDADDVVALALRYLGLPRCNDSAADLTVVQKLLLDLMPKADLFDASQPVDWLVQSRAIAAMAWNGDAMRARKRQPTLRYAYPREGVTVWTDTLVVPRGGANREAALQFMAFMLRPENAALQSNFTGYANAIHGSEAMLSADLQTAPEIIIPPQARLEFLQACDESIYGRYRAIWSKVKQARTRN